MHFFHPYFLFGLFAVLIPVIIHLFNFRRFKRVYFTNVKFIKELKSETKRKSRLKHLLVLLLRILAVCALVLAFAQPFIPVSNDMIKQGTRKAVTVYVDNSFSMEALSEEASLLGIAKKKAREIAAVYASTDLFQLLTNDFKGRDQRFISKDEFLERINEVNSSPGVKQLSEVFQRQSDLLNELNNETRISYMISDFQKNISDFDEIPDDTSKMMFFIPVRAELKNNLYIDSCWFESPVQQVGQHTTLNIRIKNTADIDYEKIPVKLLINNIQKAVTSFDVKAHSETTLQLPYTVFSPGVQFGELQIVDYPVTYDDQFYFSYQVAESISVLCINDEERSSYLDAIFGNDSAFLYSTANSRQLDYSTFNAFNLIILNSVKSVSSGLAQELKRFIENGGSLVVFPAVDMYLQDYAKFLNRVNAGFYRAIDTSNTKVVKINVNHALYNDVFDRIPENIDLPIVKAWFPIRVLTHSNQETLLELQNNNLFLNVQQIEKGLLYLFAVPLDDQFSNFQKHAIFVPTLYKMAVLSLSAGKLFYTIGKDEIVELNKVRLIGDNTFRIKRLDSDFEVIPGFRSMESRTLIYLQNIITEAGNYKLESEDLIIGGLSFNYDRKESDLDCYDTEEIREILSDRKNSAFTKVVSGTGRSFSETLEDFHYGKRLWKWFVLLALIFLAGEVLVLRFVK